MPEEPRRAPALFCGLLPGALEPAVGLGVLGEEGEGALLRVVAVPPLARQGPLKKVIK